jgi:hypothetical protein
MKQKQSLSESVRRAYDSEIQRYVPEKRGVEDDN